MRDRLGRLAVSELSRCRAHHGHGPAAQPRLHRNRVRVWHRRTIAGSMREVAAAFGAAHPGTTVAVPTGSTPSWIEDAKADADMIFSGSEVVTSDLQAAMGDRIDPATVRPFYLHPAAIHAAGQPEGDQGRHRPAASGSPRAGGEWRRAARSMGGRIRPQGHIEDVRAFCANIATVAPNSAATRDAWTKDRMLDAWLIWTIGRSRTRRWPTKWSRSAVFRDVGVVLTKAGAAKPEAKASLHSWKGRKAAAPSPAGAGSFAPNAEQHAHVQPVRL